MHIAIVTHIVAHNNGQGRVNYEIVRHALDSGHRVTLLASEVAPELISHPQVRWIKISVNHRLGALVKHQIFAFKSALAIRKIRKDIDILHVNGFITWASSDVNSVHFVHHGWLNSGFYPFRVDGGLKAIYQIVNSRVNALLEARAFRSARVVVPVSNAVAAEISHVGLPAERIQVIHNGVDTNEFCPGPASRSSFGLPEGKQLLLFAGDMRTPRKNLDTLFQAMSSLPNDFCLIVAGDHAVSRYPDLARQLGLGEKVKFVGTTTRMAELMRSVDIFVFPSRYEAMSLVLLEAIASGLPVVTSVRTGGTEILDATCSVLLDDPNDAAAIAGAIMAISSSREVARNMACAARQIAERYTWNRMAMKYVALYQRLRAQDIGRGESIVSIDSPKVTSGSSNTNTRSN